MLLSILLFVLSIAVVVKSADWFLESAEKVGLYLKIHSFILGVVLVGFGTSLPELTTSIASVVDGQYGITIPNIVGSNIANILLIIGVSTIILGTIRFEKDLTEIDLPLLIATTTLFGLLVIDGNLSRLDGGLLLASFVGYIIYSLYYNENEDYQRGLTKLIFALSRNRPNNKLESTDKPKIFTYAVLVISVLMLGLGSKFAVDNLLVIVEEMSIAVGVISFFALAIGTSLPELTVSVKALKKGQGDVLVGNIIGSCMFNMLLIGGVASLLHPQTLSMAQGPWMVAGLGLSALILLASGLTKRIHIWEGAAFVLVYVAISFHII